MDRAYVSACPHDQIAAIGSRLMIARPLDVLMRQPAILGMHISFFVLPLTVFFRLA